MLRSGFLITFASIAFVPAMAQKPNSAVAGPTEIAFESLLTTEVTQDELNPARAAYHAHAPFELSCNRQIWLPDRGGRTLCYGVAVPRFRE